MMHGNKSLSVPTDRLGNVLIGARHEFLLTVASSLKEGKLKPNPTLKEIIVNVAPEIAGDVAISESIKDILRGKSSPPTSSHCAAKHKRPEQDSNLRPTG